MACPKNASMRSNRSDLPVTVACLWSSFIAPAPIDAWRLADLVVGHPLAVEKARTFASRCAPKILGTGIAEARPCCSNLSTEGWQVDNRDGRKGEENAERKWAQHQTLQARFTSHERLFAGSSLRPRHGLFNTSTKLSERLRSPKRRNSAADGTEWLKPHMANSMPKAFTKDQYRQLAVEALGCQFASNCDPLFASNRDPSAVMDLLSTRWFGATIRMRLG